MRTTMQTRRPKVRNPRNWRRIALVGAGAVFSLCALSAVVGWIRNRPEPRLIPLNATPEQVQQARALATTPEQQAQFREEFEDWTERREVETAMAYVSLGSDEERRAFLNRRPEGRGRPQGGGNPGGFAVAPQGGGPPGGGGRGQGQGGGGRVQGQGGGGRVQGQGGGGRGQGRGGGGPGGGRTITAGQRAERTRARLTNTTPQERAALQRYREDLRQWRAERGFPTRTRGSI